MKKSILFITALLISSYSYADTPYHDTLFPGGYLSLGIQIGKSKNKTKYIDIQISPSVVLVSPYNQDVPVYLFLGISLGKRYTKDKTVIYYDTNINLWNPLINLGVGKGFILDNGKKISRNKYWGGLGFIPIIVCTDNYAIDEIKHKQYGVMGVLLLPFFGNSFYP